MNILLADQAKDSEETESTNGLGKSTFVRIVHFCLGSDFSREKVLDHPELKNVTFYLDFEWRGADYTVARRQAVDEVRALFAEFTSVLYKVPGRLSVDVAQAGYRFSFVIDREGSDGVGQMVIFCFDLAVACLWARSKAGLGVLIHDSTLFADVDPRQISSALSLAKKKSEEFGFQYICCLNSGSTSNEHFKNFDIDPFVRLRLTDDSPKGRLLGKQLRPRERHDLHN